MRKFFIYLFILTLFVSFTSCGTFKKVTKSDTENKTKIKTRYNSKDTPIKRLRIGSLKPGKYEYNATIELRGETYYVKLFRDIKFMGNDIILSEDIHLPLGKSTDKYVIDTSSILPISRVAYEGIDEVLNLSFSRNNIQGYIITQTGKSAINFGIKSPVLGDGASIDLAISLLPLEVGYTNTLKFYDFRLDDIRTCDVEVPSIDEIQCPLGTFKCYRVLLKDSDNKTLDIYWISTDEIPKIIKAEIQIPTDFSSRRKAFELVNIY